MSVSFIDLLSIFGAYCYYSNRLCWFRHDSKLCLYTVHSAQHTWYSKFSFHQYFLCGTTNRSIFHCSNMKRSIHDEIQYDVNTSCNTAQRSVYLPLWHVLISYCCRLLLRYTTPRFGISILCLHSVHGCVNWEWNRFSAVSEVKHGMARRGKVRQNKTRQD